MKVLEKKDFQNDTYSIKRKFEREKHPLLLA